MRSPNTGKSSNRDGLSCLPNTESFPMLEQLSLPLPLSSSVMYITAQWKGDEKLISEIFSLRKSQMLGCTRMQVCFTGLICADASWYNCYAIVQALGITEYTIFFLYTLPGHARSFLPSGNFFMPGKKVLHVLLLTCTWPLYLAPWHLLFRIRSYHSFEKFYFSCWLSRLTEKSQTDDR